MAIRRACIDSYHTISSIWGKDCTLSRLRPIVLVITVPERCVRMPTIMVPEIQITVEKKSVSMV